MARQNPPKLVDPHNAHLQAQLQALGIPSGRDRALEAARQKRADSQAFQPRVIDGNLKDQTATKALLQVMADRGDIIDETEEGGSYGDEYHHPVLVNANSPESRFYTQSAADTTSTTNLASTVSAMTGVFALPDGKWDVRAKGSVGATHDAGGVGAVAIEIDGNEGTVRTYSGLPTSGGSRIVASHNLDDVVGARNINVRVRYRSNTSGTTGAKNPELSVTAKRVE